MNSTFTDSKVRALSACRFTTRELVAGGMFAAVLAVISQISLPMPTGIPITIQMFGVALTGVVLGSRLGLLATITYVLIGAVGLPVFSNFHGGLAWLAGLTGGYIWSWPIMAALCGIRPAVKKRRLSFALTVILSLTGLLISETIGGLQWAALAGDKSVQAVFSYAIIAFIPKDILLTILAVCVGIPMRKMLRL